MFPAICKMSVEGSVPTVQILRQAKQVQCREKETILPDDKTNYQRMEKGGKDRLKG